jgi:alanine transaminase
MCVQLCLRKGLNIKVLQVAYFLDEDNQWSLDVVELERSINEARKTCHPRAIVVINPGNPTGQVLTRNNIEEIIMFAHREGLFIFADEVYQVCSILVMAILVLPANFHN